VHLYVHVPFCARRCSYCDFAIAVRRNVPSREFVDAILREWEGRHRHPVWDESPVVETVYFGGGTPSRLDPAGIGRMLARFRADRPLAPDAEITLEANPDDVTPQAAMAWRAAGINRVSLGVQSFDPAALAWMHRIHTAEQVPVAVESLRQAGIADLSLDLIFGLPASVGRGWGSDLDRALALEPTHLSLYGLTVEEHTPLGRWTATGRVVPADEERYADEFVAAHQGIVDAGYEHYEVSNAARPGYRARHNTAYWRRAPFIGLGPSAHSAFGCTRQWNVREWQAYYDSSQRGEPLVGGRETLTADQIAVEETYLGLRTLDGLAAARVPEPARTAWAAAGWARIENDRVILTSEGWLRLDALAASVS
jgi:oxygen-independent coproporphyrinogen-3 oxidase